MSVDHGDFGRSAIIPVREWSHRGIDDWKQMGVYRRIENGCEVVIGEEKHKHIGSRTKPNTKWVRQHLFLNLERARFKVVEVNTWKGSK